MNEKGLSWREYTNDLECATETSGATRGLGVKIMTIPTKQGSVLTNQCLGS
jgi:hypothetical protein